MNIKQVSYGLVAALMLTGACASCTNKKYSSIAKENAVKYLTENERFRAEKYAEMQINYTPDDVNVISYWDSLLIEAKSKAAYVKGQQFIRDSIDKKFHRKENYKPTLNTIFEGELIPVIQKEYFSYVTPQDSVKAIKNEPKRHYIHFLHNESYQTHYWNTITMSGKQNESYQKGMADARKEINKK